MKNLEKLISGLLLVSMPLISHAAKTVLCGQFKYKPQNTVTVLYYATPLDNIEHNQTRIEGDVDASGNFKLELNIDQPTRINVMHGNEWLFYNKFIGPGDSLRFEFDSTSTVIKGPGENGIGSMFLYEAGITEHHVDQNKDSYQTINEVEFAKYWDGQVDSEVAFYDNYFAKNPVSPEYAATIKIETRYEAMIKLVRFGSQGKKLNLELFKNPEYWRYFTKNAFNDSNALSSPNYVSFLGDLTKYLLEPTAGWSGKKIPFFDRLPLRDSIARKYLTGKVYDVELYDILYDGVKQVNQAKGKPQFDTVYEKAAAAISTLGKGFHDKDLAMRINKKLEATREEGKPAYDFFGCDVGRKKGAVVGLLG